MEKISIDEFAEHLAELNKSDKPEDVARLAAIKVHAIGQPVTLFEVYKDADFKVVDPCNMNVNVYEKSMKSDTPILGAKKDWTVQLISTRTITLMEPLFLNGVTWKIVHQCHKDSNHYGQPVLRDVYLFTVKL